RPGAIARMRRALDEYFIGGIKSNLPLFRRILEHEDFAAARIDTGFLDRLLAAGPEATAAGNGLQEIAALAAALFAATAPQKNGPNGARASAGKSPDSAWKRAARSEGMRSE